MTFLLLHTPRPVIGGRWQTMEHGEGGDVIDCRPRPLCVPDGDGDGDGQRENNFSPNCLSLRVRVMNFNVKCKINVQRNSD